MAELITPFSWKHLSHLASRTSSCFDFLPIVRTAATKSPLLVPAPLPDLEMLKYFSVLTLALFSVYTESLGELI